MACNKHQDSQPEFISCMDGEDWFFKAPDLYQFHAEELRRHKDSILGHFREDIDCDDANIVPDPGVINALIKADCKWKSRQPVIVAELRNGQYLARVFHIDSNHSSMEFIVLDSRNLGTIVYQFEWSLSAYWSNFGYGNRGGCCLTSGFIKFLVRTSAMKNFAIIVGPSEDNIMPTTKLLQYRDNMWQIKDMVFENEKEGLERSWPVNVIFHERPDSDPVVFLQLSTEQTWVYTRATYSFRQGQPDNVCKYNVEKDSIVVSRQADKQISNKCFDLVNNGQHLVLLQPCDDTSSDSAVNRTYVEGKTFEIVVLDTDLLESKVRIVYNFPENDPDFETVQKFLPVPFLSLCKKYFAILFWMKQWRSTEPTWTVSTFKVRGFMNNVMTLRQIARISILRSTKITCVKHLPIPQTLQDYLIK